MEQATYDSAVVIRGKRLCHITAADFIALEKLALRRHWESVEGAIKAMKIPPGEAKAMRLEAVRLNVTTSNMVEFLLTPTGQVEVIRLSLSKQGNEATIEDVAAMGLGPFEMYDIVTELAGINKSKPETA